MEYLNSIEKGLHEAYLDYVNNFLTHEGYASFYGLSESVAAHIIDAGRLVAADHGLDS